MGVVEVLDVANKARPLGTSLLSLLARLRKRRADRAAPSPPPTDQATRAALNRGVATAAVGLSMDLQMLEALQRAPRLVGALWTLPNALRINGRLPARLTDLMDALRSLCIGGADPVVDAALEMAQELGELAAAFPRPHDSSGRTAFEERATAVAERLGDFVDEARLDLARE